MTKDEDFKLLKIQTCVLKVNIHCDGCKQKVKKLLQRTEGVYTVNIDAEQQKVTVSGSIDSATLIKKLERSGKHAEIWSQKTNQNQKQKPNCIKDENKNSNHKGQKQGLIKGLEAFKHQQKMPAFSSEEDEDYFDDEDDDEEEEELRFLKEKAHQLGLLRQQQQQAVEANNAKKGMSAIAAAINNGKANNGGKKGNQNQNMGLKANPSGILDPKTMAALKMSNPQLGNGGNIIPGEAKRGNDLNAMMGLAGFHGNDATVGSALGGPSNLGAFQASTAVLPTGGYAAGHHHPSSMVMNMNGYHHPSAMSMMNMQNRHAMQQPQMMYHRSPFIAPNTGYYNYAPSPYPYGEPIYSGDHSSAAHMFSDENTSSCSVM